MSEIGRVSQRVIELRAKEQERNRLAEEKRLLEEEKEHEKLLLRLAEYSSSVSSFFNSLSRTDSGEMLEDFDIPLEWTKSDWLDECPSYRNLKQNLYRPPLQRPLYNAGDDAPICSCTAVDNCGSTCHNRNLFMECDPSSCPSVHATTVCKPVLSSRLSTARQTTLAALTTPEEHETPHHEDGEGEAAVSATSSLQFCRNTAIQTKTYPPTTVFRSAQCGHALKVLQDVPANTILIEYLGEVITSRECSERMSEYEEQDDFYFAALGNGLMLDAKHMGSPARFANHSCDPNCTLQKWTVLGEPRIVLVSLRDLLAGAELTYNYQYFDDGFADMKRQTCRCGARQCCGTIGGKVLVPVEDVLVTKVQAALSSGRRQSVEQYESLLHQLQTSAAAHYPQTTLLIEKIQAILSDCDDWLARYSALMGLSATSNQQALVEMSSVESLLSTAPSAARIEECVALDALLKKAVRAEKTIAQLRDIVCGDNSVGRKSSRPTEKSHELTVVKIEPVNSTTDTMDTIDTTDNSVTTSSDTAVQKVAAPSTANTVSGVSAVKEDSTAARGRLIWEDVAAAFRLVSASLPLRCPSTSLLVGYINQYSAWCRRHVLPVAPAADLVDPSVQPLTTTRGVIQHVAQIYTENTHSADFTRFSQDLFLAADFCESRLEIYMENRNRIVTQSETAETTGPPVDKESSHTLKLESPIVQPQCTALLNILLARAERHPGDEQVAAAVRAVKAFSGCECPSISPPSSKRKESDSAPLYCFCRLPEAQGESRVMSQCGGCGDWFHPQCVNAALVSLTAVSRSSAKDEMFTCPVCLHLSNSISNFAFAPGTEWRRIAAQPSEVSLAKRNIKAEPKGRPATTQQKKKNVHPSTGSNKRPRSAAECGQHPESDLLPTMRGGGDRLAKSLVSSAVPTAPKAKRSAVRPKDYMSSADLAACLVEEKTLPITGTPVALLLVLCEKFSAQWQERVRHHMLSPSVLEVVERLKNRHLLTSIAGEEAAFSPVSLSLEALLVEAAVLQESLRLYFELRVLRVCPVAETGLLRELVWSISASAFQREVTLHSVANDNDSTTAATPAVVVWRSSAPSLGVLQEVIRGGEAVASAHGVVNNSQFLQSLKCVLAAAVQWMADADRCSSLHEALLLTDRLALLSGVVNLSETFVCAKLRCVTRPTSLFVRSKSITVEAVDVADAEHGDSLSAADAVSAATNVEPSLDALVGDFEGDLAAGEPVYCLCREGDDGRTMICCDRCDEWFHSSCVGVSEERRRQSSGAAHSKKAKKGVAASSIDQFTCISCCVQSGAIYPHTW